MPPIPRGRGQGNCRFCKQDYFYRDARGRLFNFQINHEGEKLLFEAPGRCCVDCFKRAAIFGTVEYA